MENISAVPVTVVEADKVGSVVSKLALQKTLAVGGDRRRARAGDVVVVQALTDSATYNQLELPSGRLAKINPGDIIVGALGRRRALKGFVGDVPELVAAGDGALRTCTVRSVVSTWKSSTIVPSGPST